MAGRPRKPDELKVVHGTFRADRELKGEPPGDENLTINPPAWMTPRSRELFLQMVERVRTYRILASADVDALALCARTLEMAEIASKALKTEDDYFQTNENTQMQSLSPAYLLYERTLKEYLAYASKFGLTSFDRAKIKIEKPKSLEPTKKVSLR